MSHLNGLFLVRHFPRRSGGELGRKWSSLDLNWWSIWDGGATGSSSTHLAHSAGPWKYL